MKRYFRNLQEHPGVPVATMMSLLCGYAGLSNETFSPKDGIIFGVSVSLIFWIPVLVTNYTNNKNQVVEEKEKPTIQEENSTVKPLKDLNNHG